MDYSTPPQYFICPITRNIMNVPLIDNEGNSYEQTAIEKWLETHNTSPITRNCLLIKHLKLNRSLKDAIAEYIKKSPQQDVVMIEDNEIIIDDKNIINLNINTYEKSIDERLVKISVKSIQCINSINMDIVVVIDVSASMNSKATVEQYGVQVDVGFTILDITKHAIRTVIESMKNGDRISIITFSDTSTIVCNMMTVTMFNKEHIKSLVTNLKAYGCTNVWAGINTGLKQFIKTSYNNSRTSSLLFLTDGIPSSHLLPPRGILDSLKYSLNKMKGEYIIPSIYTFGFGYSIDTQLLVDIAKIGNGSFSYIPDSGFVGTVIIHALANISTVCGSNALLRIQPSNGSVIKHIYGYNENSISLDTLHYCQSKEIVILIETNNSENNILDIRLEYESYNNNFISIDGYAVNNGEIYNIDLEKSIMRLELVELLKLILKKYPSDNLDKEIDNFTIKYHWENNIITDLNEQVKLSILNKENYNKWGKNYIYSLIFAHGQQKCNNFKDKSISGYGGELFIRQRDIIDDIYSNMNPPKPSLNVINGDNVKTDVDILNNSMNFGNIFNNSNSGCFHESSKIVMYNGTLKRCKEVKKGDKVLTSNKSFASVVCVIKIKCHNGKCDMIKFGEVLKITPYHPIKNFENIWTFPIEIGNICEYECEYIYNYILDTSHTVFINNIECVTLGHGLTDNEVVKHEYYGTEKVIKDLIKMKGFDEGIIIFDTNCIIRNYNGKVLCFDETKVV
jgi:Mg-chelatase subunit ChlD